MTWKFMAAGVSSPDDIDKFATGGSSGLSLVVVVVVVVVDGVRLVDGVGLTGSLASVTAVDALFRFAIVSSCRTIEIAEVRRLLLLC